DFPYLCGAEAEVALCCCFDGVLDLRPGSDKATEAAFSDGRNDCVHCDGLLRILKIAPFETRDISILILSQQDECIWPDQLLLQCLLDLGQEIVGQKITTKANDDQVKRPEFSEIQCRRARLRVLDSRLRRAPDQDSQMHEFRVFLDIPSHDLVPMVLEVFSRCERL